MAVISFTIPDDKLPRVIAAINGLHPVPRDENNTPLYTPAQWAKEYFRRLMVRETLEYERRQAENSVQMDDSMVS